MERTDRNKRLFLVRVAPDSRRATEAVAAVRSALDRQGGEITVFFHGAGVRHALDRNAGDWTALGDRVRLEVCGAAWTRRCDGDLAAPFKRSSLVQFWRLAGAAGEVTCFGVDDDC